MSGFWIEFWAQLAAGGILVTLALIAEAWLDEWRDLRHEKKQTTRKRS